VFTSGDFLFPDFSLNNRFQSYPRSPTMPTLPWKKNRRGTGTGTRISRIVADLQSPPKRGGSLVVETGFPTSLIDLFVKNRDRWRKKSSKINKSNKTHLQIQHGFPPPSPPPSVSDSSTVSGSSGFDGDGDPTPLNEIEEVVHDGDESTESLCVDRRDLPRAAYAVAFKLFVMLLVLAMSTKRLAVGITMSAFLLIFADRAWKRSVRFLEPCGTARTVFEFLHQRVSQIGRIENGLLVLKSVNTHEGSVAEEDIQIVESNCDLNEEQRAGEIVRVGPELELLSRDKRWGCLENEKNFKDLEDEMDGGQVLVRGDRRSRSARVKAKIIKKLLPKKLRNSKKDKKSKGMKEGESSSEVSSVFGDDSLEEQDDQQEREIEHRSPTLSLLPEVLDDGNHSSNESTLKKKEGREIKGNWVYLSLLVIVLAGLAGGRVVALGVTISWCFMLKLIVTRRRSVDVPMIRCPVSISS
jgi:hypothetical protein